MGAHAPCHGGGVIACHTAADHHDGGRRDTGDATHEHAAAALGAHQVVGADVRGEAAGDLAHRREQWQCDRSVRAGGLHGLIGDRGGARCQQGVCARPRGSQMQVGEQHLTPAHAAVLGLDRFLDLQQQIGVGPHLIGGRDDRRSGRGEVGVVDGRSLAGAGLHQHLMATVHQLGHAGGGDGDAVLVVLDLGGDADAHWCS